MKKIVRLCGLLLLAALLFSVLGGSAFADNDPPVQIGDDNTFAFTASFDGMTEEDKAALAADENYQREKPEVSIVINAIEDELTEGEQVKFLPLFTSDAKLIISPPAGYFISDLALASGDSTEKSEERLTTAAQALNQNGTPVLSLSFKDLLPKNAEAGWLDSKWLSGGPATDYILYVTCDVLPTDVPVITYNPVIDLGSAKLIDSESYSFQQSDHTVYSVTDAARSAALDQAKAFNGFKMIYKNGSYILVSSDQRIQPYMDVTLEAQWIPAEKPTPVVLPVITITADNAEKEYDGTPLQKNSYTANPNPEEYGYKLKDVLVEGYVTEPGNPTANVVKSFAVTDSEDNVVTDPTILSKFTTANGTLTVNPRSLTVKAVKCTLATNGEEKIASQITTQDGFYLNGYHAEGLLTGHELAGDFVTGRGTTTFDTSINENALIVRDVNSDEDVTSYYALKTEPGQVTINNVTPPASTYNVTITLKSGTWTYDGTAHRQPDYEITGLVDGDKVFKVNYKSTAVITNVGTESNDIDTVEFVTKDGAPVPEGKYRVTSRPGTLTVNQRNLTVTAITTTISTNGEEKTASQLSTTDGVYRNGYRVEGLLESHELVGDFVTGHGRTSFDTGIDSNKISIRVKNSATEVTANYSITTKPGRVTITEPTVHDVVITLKSGTWTYDGKPHYQPDYEVSGLVDGDKISKVNFKPTAVITNVGTATNDIQTVEIVTKDNQPVPKEKYQVTSHPATLKVNARSITVTAISGSLTSNGGEITASKLESPDHEYKYGYKVDNLASDHKLSGDFVQGKGTSGFQTWIDLNKLQVLDGSNHDVTDNYSIHTVDGYITININNQTQPQSKVYITITAKSGSFVYDGNPHTMNEYTVSGLVDGDKVDKVTFKTTSTITNVGTQANEIQSAVIKTSSGAAVDSSKYSITYVPGKLTVTKFPLTLTAVSDSKTYDGKALSNKSVKSTALANSDHKLSADYEVYDSNGNSIKNGPVDVGVYVKKVSNIKITSGTTDVTSNYEITTEDGTLTIRTASGGTSANSVTNTAYYGNTYTIRSDAPYSEFQYLLIDGRKVPTDSYTVKEGSTVITLKASYIQGLKTGNHNYSIVSTSRQADGTFNVAKAPKTSDGTSSALWIILLAAAAIAVAVAYFFLKRSPKHNRKTPVPTGGQNGRSAKSTAASRGSAASATARTAAAQFGRQKPKTPVQKKPVSDTVMDFESFFGADADRQPQKAEADPSIDLVPNFRINLDDYRTPAQVVAETVPQETTDKQQETTTVQSESRNAAEEVPVKEENTTAEIETVPDITETAAVTEEAVPAKPAEEIPEAAASDPENSVDKILEETDALLSSLTGSGADPATDQDSPAVSYIGRHEAQKHSSSASSWYRPHDSDPDSK
ncbi:MAG: hypothetical protein II873_05685 [Oscillospiraceae bacterium]|nr:hypothetical protein [Oscillospiraceae bacterium]